jgi:hypothetical protein
VATSGREDPEGKVGFFELMLALAVTKLPEGGAWSYELKLETTVRHRSQVVFSQCTYRFAIGCNSPM